MIRKIYLHGFLGKKYAKVVELDVANMFQTMNALISRFGPEFKNDVAEHNWHVFDGAKKQGNDLDEKELDKKLSKKSLHLVPAVEGASSVLRVVLGVVLIAAGVFFKQSWLVKLGAIMVLGGVSEMLVKPPTMDGNKLTDQAQGSIFNSALNVTTQGGPVPLIYGRVRRASSVVISTDFSSEERNV